MYSTTALKGREVRLLRGNGGTPTEAFTEVAEVLSIDGPNLSQEAVKIGIDANGANMYFGGALEGGEVNLELNFVPNDANQNASAGLLKDWKDGVLRNFKIEFPDQATTTWSFTALVTKFTPGASQEKQVTASVTLKISGMPNLNAGA